MKKNKKTRLVVAREVLRVLLDHEHRFARGGYEEDPETLTGCPRPPPTGDSIRICCA
jgi:hypothetical protein